MNQDPFSSFNGYRKEKMTLGVLAAPIHVYWEVTSKCNLHCKHCYVSAGDGSVEELKTHQAINLIGQLADAKVFTVTLTGGEPLLRKDIFQIIKLLSKRNIYVSLSSNGTMITENVARKLQKCGLRTVTISLDGATAASNDYIRGKGSYERTLNALKSLRKVGIKVTLQMTILKNNFREVSRIVEIGKEMGADHVTFSRLVPLGRAVLNRTELELSKEETIEVAYILKQLKNQNHDYISSDYIIWYDRLSSLNNVQTIDRHFKDITLLNCSAGKHDCTITPDGFVLPCGFLRDLKCGNILQQEFLDIWKNSPTMKNFRKLMYVSIDKVQWKCRRCKLRYKCGGGCRAAAFLTYNDLTAPDPICWLEV